ncbi:hypothetical protein [Streptomyces sp. NPDC058964]|uniref:hypothetical protein n=1 Tax=Streptomyces sp. NPDC058964 TaxID=3346681 RepID=UPI003677B6A6
MPEVHVFTRYGGPETGAPGDGDRPVPGPGRLPVAFRAARVNPVDRKQQEGRARGENVIEVGA